MLQDGGIAKVAEGFLEHSGVLLNDTCERNHEDDAVETVCNSVIECERQRRQRLSAARWDRQRKHVNAIVCMRSGVREDLGAGCVDGIDDLECA